MYMKGFKVAFEGNKEQNKPTRMFEAIDFRMEYEEGSADSYPKGHIYICLTDQREIHFCTQGDGQMIKDIMNKIMSDYERDSKFSDGNALSSDEAAELEKLRTILKTNKMSKAELDRLQALSDKEKEAENNNRFRQKPIRIPNCYGIVEIRSAEIVKNEKETLRAEDYGERGF